MAHRTIGDLKKVISPRSIGALRRNFLDTIDEFAESILGPNSNFCRGLDPKIQEEILFVNDVSAPSPIASPRVRCKPTTVGPVVVSTTCNQLAEVLGKVVEVVVVATREGSTKYDCSALNALMEGKPEDVGEDLLELTYEELNKVVLRLVQSAKESVEKGTMKPTGISISNFGIHKRMVDLHWGKNRVSGYLTTGFDPGQDLAIQCYSL